MMVVKILKQPLIYSDLIYPIGSLLAVISASLVLGLAPDSLYLYSCLASSLAIGCLSLLEVRLHVPGDGRVKFA